MENNGQVPIIAERDRYRKQLTFDIDTKTLEIYYPKANWRHGYDDIRGYLKREGFEWCEGTVYVSSFSILTVLSAPIIRKVIFKCCSASTIFCTTVRNSRSFPFAFVIFFS